MASGGGRLSLRVAGLIPRAALAVPIVATALALATTEPGAHARPPLPDGCGVSEIRGHLQRFFAAANSGEVSRVAPFIAPRGELNGFGIGPADRRWLFSADPGKVARFFATRAKHGLRYRLLGGSVDDLAAGQLSGPWERPESGPAADDPVVAFGIVARVTQSHRPVLAAIGKAGMNCVSGRFFNWQMGINPPQGTTRPCGNKPPIDVLDPPRSPVICRTPF